MIAQVCPGLSSQTEQKNKQQMTQIVSNAARHAIYEQIKEKQRKWESQF
jgi:hypothetical protein